MNEKRALEILENMPEGKFQEFFKSLPYRVQLSCRGGLTDWRDALSKWYITHNP